jgi:hypothetical protein
LEGGLIDLVKRTLITALNPVFLERDPRDPRATHRSDATGGDDGHAQKRHKDFRFHVGSKTTQTTARVKLFGGDSVYRNISTSHTERQNLTMRMSMRRFTRLTNAFSKRIENHETPTALHYMYYNFARIHRSLRVTPAMEAGIADHVWTLEEIASLF